MQGTKALCWLWLFVAQGQWIEQTARSYNWPWLNEVIKVVWIRLAIAQLCLFRFTGAYLLFFFQKRRKKKGKFDKAIVHSMHSICDQMDFIHPTLMGAVAGSNPIKNPQLPAKVVDQPSVDCFERTTSWVPCTDGIELQFLRSVRFWNSLVRNILRLGSADVSIVR